MKKYHRKWEGWDYRGISTMVDGREIIYYTLNEDGEESSGVEVYGGKNYIVESDARSHSRHHSLAAVPEKYKSVVKKLMAQHKKTKWSNKENVNLFLN